MNYKIASKNDFSEIAKVHLVAFNNFFLSELGHSFLSIYYKAVISNKSSIAICALNEANVIVGFASGCEKSKGYNRQLIFSNLIPFFFIGIKLIFTRPKAIWRLLSNIEKNANSEDDGNYAELLSIGVVSQAKGLGVGKELLQKFENEVLLRGCKTIALTTDFYNNESVIAFYKKCGYNVLYDFTTYPNRKMYKMIKHLIHRQ